VRCDIKRLTLTFLGFVAALMIATAIIFALSARSYVDTCRQDFMGLTIDVESTNINWLYHGVTLKNVKIYPAGKKGQKHLLASADEMYAKISPMSLLWGTIRISKIELIKAKVNYISYRKGNNWRVLDFSSLDKEDGSFWKIHIDKVELEDGEVLWRDRVSGGKFELKDVDAQIKKLVNEPNPDKLPSKLKVNPISAGNVVSSQLRLIKSSNIMTTLAKIWGASCDGIS